MHRIGNEGWNVDAGLAGHERDGVAMKNRGWPSSCLGYTVHERHHAADMRGPYRLRGAVTSPVRLPTLDGPRANGRSVGCPKAD